MPSAIADNLARVRQRIGESAERAGRSPNEVSLVAVTKTFPVERIQEAMGLGLHVFGENRVQEAISKIDVIGRAGASWHLIGHLQSNKARFIEGRFDMVQSIDSAAIVEVLGGRLHAPLDVLIEINVAEEPQKTGALPRELDSIVQAIGHFGTLRLQGLMTVAPMTTEAESLRPVFQRLRALRDELAQRLGRPLPVLSMGMSEDYPIAVEEGATMLRLGRAIFGPR